MNDMKQAELLYRVAQTDHYRRIEAARLARELRGDAPTTTHALWTWLRGSQSGNRPTVITAESTNGLKSE